MDAVQAAAWAGAGASTLAAIVPGILFVLERRDRQAAEAQVAAFREREEQERVMGQARRMTVWTTKRATMPLSYVALIDNASDMPVFNVELFAFRLGQDPETKELRRARTGDFSSGTMAPGHQEEVKIGYLNTKEPVWVRFTDARDVVWYRCDDGTLTTDERDVARRFLEQAVYELPLD